MAPRDTGDLVSLVGDNGYDDQPLRDPLRAEGVRPLMKHRLFAGYDHAHNARLDSEAYGPRWMAETAFSAIKCRYGSVVRPSVRYREFRELALTAAVSNLKQVVKR
nr:transposase [Halorientalis marina]